MKKITRFTGAFALMGTLALVGCPKTETPEALQSPASAAVTSPTPPAIAVASPTPLATAVPSPSRSAAILSLTHPSATPKAAPSPSGSPKTGPSPTATPKAAHTATPAPKSVPTPKATPIAVATPKPAAHAILGPAADFTLKTADGAKPVKLSDYKGKVRIVDFWATWCPPCRGEIPDFVALQKQYGAKGLQVIGVSMDRGGPEIVTKFMQENGMNYVSLMSESSVEAAYGGIRAIPSTFLVDRDGNIVKKYVGGQEKATFENDLKALL